MTITRERIADLCPGDVVELRDDRWPEGTVTRGPLRKTDHGLCVAALMVVDSLGDLFDAGGHRSLTVVSRVPRPLYVNHSRTEPVPGDVVRDADRPTTNVWVYHGLPDEDAPWDPPLPWAVPGSGLRRDRAALPARLRLLVDGETGEAVQ